MLVYKVRVFIGVSLPLVLLIPKLPLLRALMQLVGPQRELILEIKPDVEIVRGLMR